MPFKWQITKEKLTTAKKYMFFYNFLQNFFASNLTKKEKILDFATFLLSAGAVCVCFFINY